MNKLDVSIEGLSFLCENSIFQDPFQSLFSLMSRVLGLDDDRVVFEVTIGCLLKVSQSKSPKCLNFDEFLVEKIHSQLENFHLEKTFKFQSLLFLMVTHENQSTLHEKKPYIFTENLNCSMEVGGLSFFNSQIK